MIHSAYKLSFARFNEQIHYQAVMFIAISLVLSLGCLFGMHTYFLLRNQSTLEMDALYSTNPFARTKKVKKTKKDRQARNLSINVSGRQE
jgi:hypothetical protein